MLSARAIAASARKALKGAGAERPLTSIGPCSNKGGGRDHAPSTGSTPVDAYLGGCATRIPGKVRRSHERAAVGWMERKPVIDARNRHKMVGVGGASSEAADW
ncbi:hypothetical protein GCM10020220_046270 [Nonomuraea rubra]